MINGLQLEVLLVRSFWVTYDFTNFAFAVRHMDKMNTSVRRTPKSGRQSLFFQDLATPVSSRRSGGKFTTPGQAAAVSALWRENFANSDLPPPPVFTLEDRFDLSPESGIHDYPVSPEVKSDPRTPVQSFGRELTTPKSKSDASTSYAGASKQPQHQSQQSPMVSSSWWSPAKTSGSAEQEDKGKGSPVEGVVHPGALITLPPPREVARPEVKKNLAPVGNLNEEEWVTVYGYHSILFLLRLLKWNLFWTIMSLGAEEPLKRHKIYIPICDKNA